MVNLTSQLRFKPLGIDTQHEHYAYMREDCHVCVSEGFEALTRIRLTHAGKTIIASLNVIRSEILQPGEISLSERAARALGIQADDMITVSHIRPTNSLSFVRSKIYGNTLSGAQLGEIVNDIVAGNYSNVHLSAFITACAGNRLETKEIIALTKAMITSGKHIHWNDKIVVDKHCIGGLPGNRTTPIVVAIVTAFGLTMPKTSSRAITSPAGTADTMEVMAPVNLPMDEIENIVLKEGGCVVWGGTAQLSPADDILIRVEKALDIDSEGQLIASVLSKKAAAGSSHVIIDMPVGPTAKLRSTEAAHELQAEMEKVARAIGLKLKVIITDGSQPVGQGIGPALEARDILEVLQNKAWAPQDLKERALLLAGELLELAGAAEKGKGNDKAREVLQSGQAYEKFMAICEAQGGFTEPQEARYQYDVKARNAGVVCSIDNRKLAKLAKLAGAPADQLAGIDFLSPIGTKVEKGQVLYAIHANSKGELNYALDYYQEEEEILTIKE